MTTNSTRPHGNTFHVLAATSFSLSILLAKLGDPTLIASYLAMQNIGTLLLCLCAPLIAWSITRLISSYSENLSFNAQNTYNQIHWLPSLLWILSAVGQTYTKPTFTYFLMCVIAITMAYIATLIVAMSQVERKNLIVSDKYVASLFLVSGFAALIYQVVWQRTLFTTFGVNSESVTVIVSVFMFGLGVGALFGGYLQKVLNKHLLLTFLSLEIAIGIFGVFSLDIIEWVGSAPASSMLALSTKVYIILALPTLLMGATLPVLVTYLQKTLHNLGQTVSLLYAANTIGSAMAALLTVYVFFVYAGQQATVWLAAAFNFSTAAMIYIRSRVIDSKTVQSDTQPTASKYPLPFWLVTVLLSLVGYIALSQEILWYRILGYMSASKPQVFGTLLFAYLLGIAAGSLRADKVSRNDENQYIYIVKVLFLSTLTFYLALPILSMLSSIAGKDLALIAGYGLVALTAYYSGGLFPILVDMGSADSNGSSSKLSILYFANIVGATTGPLVTGFYLLEHFSIEENVILLTTIALLVCLAITAALPLHINKRVQLACIGCFCMMIALFPQKSMFENHLEALFYGDKPHSSFKHVLQNRSGIIAVEAGVTDVMYGNGIYDGKFNIDPVINSNLITRTYMMAAVHKQPKRVLEIGMSTNSWSKVITMYQPLEKLDIVEINKAYTKLARFYPDSNAVLHNPKVTVYYDDGRRWLKQHNTERYDVIVMNTSFHWRSNATSLLSREFLEMCKKHLSPGGVIMYNGTSSEDAYFTAAHVFNYVTAIENFVVVSDSPFSLSAQERRNNLLRFIGDDGKAVFEKNEASMRVLEELSHRKLPDVKTVMGKRHDLWVITDDNMAVEYKNPKF